MVVFVDGLKGVFGDSMRGLCIEVRFKVSEMNEVSMPDSDECIDDHEEHGFDGFMIGVDGSCKLDDDLITVGGNEDSKKVAEPHASNQQGMIDGVFNHFVLIFENPAVNLAKIIVNDMFKTLNDYSIVYVSVCASINVSE